jgi:hypothetical protein
MTDHVRYDQVNDQWVIILDGPEMQELAKKAYERGYCITQCVTKAVCDLLKPGAKVFDLMHPAFDPPHPVRPGAFESAGVTADNLHRPTRHTPRAQKPPPRLAEEIRADNEAVDRLSRLLNRLRGEEP